MTASRELNIRQPFIEAGITKNDIREYAQILGLPNCNKPSSPCLSSRVSYGEDITIDKLRKIEKAESFLYEKKFSTVRVRYHNNIARIEVKDDDFARLISEKNEINGYFKNLGFSYITLDLEGYKMGSMNKLLVDK
jgi:uncharacterized protein